MKRLLAAAFLFAVAACGQQPNGKTEAPAAEPDSVVLGSTQNLPDWLLVARQRDCEPGGDCPRGEVHFNQRTITRNADGTADIWIQVRHGSPQLFAQSNEKTETTIRYELERLHYRFNCTDGTFIVVERQIMGPREAVVARDEPEAIYREPVRGSATGIIQPIACRGS